MYETTYPVLTKAFIKWGQWASCRPDIIPQSLCNELAVLQADAPRHSFAYTKQRVQAELGVPIESAFLSFEKEPIASGSIAQVYKAVLNLPMSFCGSSVGDQGLKAEKGKVSCVEQTKLQSLLHRDATSLPVAVKVITT